MTTLRFILLIQAVLGIFIAGGLFFKQSKFKNRSIAIFVFLFGIEIIVFLYSTSNVFYLYPEFSSGFFYMPVGFLYGPLLYLHIESLYGKSSSIVFKILHFIPAVVVGILLSDIIMMGGTERAEFLKANFHNITMPFNYARAIHILLYGFASGFLLRFNKPLQESVQKSYAISICTIYFLAASVISFLTWFADNWRQFAYYYLVINTIIMIIGYLLYSKPDFLKELTKKYLNSGLSSEEMKMISQRISKSMEEKVFLDRGMNVSKMAILVDESAHRVSQTMSSHMEKNFNEYVNYHRIEHAKEMLSNPKFDHYKIEAIGIDSGFSNKVTFYKAFVKLTSMTPAVYRNELKDA